jgi:hypothetical protein
MNIPEKEKVISLLAPAVTNGNQASATVDLSDAVDCVILVHTAKGNAAQTAFALEQSVTSGGAAKVFAKTVPIFTVLDPATSTDYTRQTDAVSYALSAANDGRSQIVAFVVDPAKLDLANGYRFARVQISTGNAANIVGITAIVNRRYSA